MSFDMSGASAHVEAISNEMAMLAVAGAQTAALLISSGNVQTGVKGSAAILTMDADVVLQDGSGCGRNPVGDVRLADKLLVVDAVKDQQNLCPKALKNTFFSEFAVKGTSPENGFDSAFVTKIMERRATKIQAVVEQLIWNGDKTLSSGNLKWTNGILKQIAGVAATTVVGTSVWAKLQNFYIQQGIDIRRQADYRLFLGEDDYELYLMEMANRNLFIPADNKRLHGTLAMLEPVAGLNGKHLVVGTRLSNLRLGLDGDNETDKATLKYSDDNDVWMQDFWFSIGIKVIFTEEIGKASIVPDEPVEA